MLYTDSLSAVWWSNALFFYFSPYFGGLKVLSKELLPSNTEMQSLLDEKSRMTQTPKNFMKSNLWERGLEKYMSNNPQQWKRKARRSANQKKRSEEQSVWLPKRPPCRVKAGSVKLRVRRHGAELCILCDPRVWIVWSVSHLHSEQEKGFLTSKKKKKITAHSLQTSPLLFHAFLQLLPSS